MSQFQENFTNNPLGSSDFERYPEFHRQIITYAQTVDAGRYLEPTYISKDVTRAKAKMREDKERITQFANLTKDVVQATKTFDRAGTQDNRVALDEAKAQLDDMGWMGDMMEIRFAQDSKEDYNKAQTRCEQEITKVAKIKSQICSSN